MILSIKEMELLCIFHNGTRAQTITLLRHAAQNKNDNPTRIAELSQLADKLESLPDGASVSLAFLPG